MPSSELVHLSFDWAGLKLAGTLHLPSGSGPHPAVLMAQGSGPADRDSGGYFGPIRQTFIDRGIATFAFDKPGCGESSGNWRHYALNGRADQATAALDLVRNHPAVDSDRVGIWGHSQGGWLVQKLANGPAGPAFAIANSGPSIGVQEQILYDCERTLRNEGYDDGQVRDALDFTRVLHQAASDGADFESVSSQLLKPMSDRLWYGSFPTIDGADDWQHVRLLIEERFEPLPALGKVDCPYLAIYGGLDVLLPPWRGAEESGLALAESATLDATVVVFPLGDHRIQDPDTKEFVDGYLDLLGDWISARAR